MYDQIEKKLEESYGLDTLNIYKSLQANEKTEDITLLALTNAYRNLTEHWFDGQTTYQENYTSLYIEDLFHEIPKALFLKQRFLNELLRGWGRFLFLKLPQSLKTNENLQILLDSHTIHPHVLEDFEQIFNEIPEKLFFDQKYIEKRLSKHGRFLYPKLPENLKTKKNLKLILECEPLLNNQTTILKNIPEDQINEDVMAHLLFEVGSKKSNFYEALPDKLRNEYILSSYFISSSGSDEDLLKIVQSTPTQILTDNIIDKIISKLSDVNSLRSLSDVISNKYYTWLRFKPKFQEIASDAERYGFTDWSYSDFFGLYELLPETERTAEHSQFLLKLLVQAPFRKSNDPVVRIYKLTPESERTVELTNQIINALILVKGIDVGGDNIPSLKALEKSIVELICSIPIHIWQVDFIEPILQRCHHEPVDIYCHLPIHLQSEQTILLIIKSLWSHTYGGTYTSALADFFTFLKPEERSKSVSHAALVRAHPNHDLQTIVENIPSEFKCEDFFSPILLNKEYTYLIENLYPLLPESINHSKLIFDILAHQSELDYYTIKSLYKNLPIEDRSPELTQQLLDRIDRPCELIEYIPAKQWSKEICMIILEKSSKTDIYYFYPKIPEFMRMDIGITKAYLEKSRHPKYPMKIINAIPSQIIDDTLAIELLKGVESSEVVDVFILIPVEIRTKQLITEAIRLCDRDKLSELKPHLTNFKNCQFEYIMKKYFRYKRKSQL